MAQVVDACGDAMDLDPRPRPDQTNHRCTGCQRGWLSLRFCWLIANRWDLRSRRPTGSGTPWVRVSGCPDRLSPDPRPHRRSHRQHGAGHVGRHASRPVVDCTWIARALGLEDPEYPFPAWGGGLWMVELRGFELGRGHFRRASPCVLNYTPDKVLCLFQVASTARGWWPELGTFRLLCCAYVVQAGRSCGRPSPLKE